MRFNLRRPCPHCPFRRGCLPEWLGRERAEEIAGSLLGGRTFACHETTEVGGAPAGREQHCAGAVLLLERLGRPSQLMRVAERLGSYVPTRLDHAADVFASPGEFIEHHSAQRDRDREEPETCAVAEIGCAAPAGYRVGAAGFAPNLDLEHGLTQPCVDCGEPVCDSCSTSAGPGPGERVCVYCGDEHDDEE